MRRLVVICASLAAVALLALPAVAFALRGSPGDGTLVVQDASGPDGVPPVPSVTLVISGTVIGRVSSGSPAALDQVVIDDPNVPGGDFSATPVQGAFLGKQTPSSTRTRFKGSDFRFRAVEDGFYKITIYGSGISLFAVGQGRVMLQGLADPSVKDGRYSLNGGDWHLMPTVPTAWLPIAQPPASNG